MSKTITPPKTSAGWLWIAVAAFAAFTVVTKGGEFNQGFDQGFSDTCAPFFAAEPGEPPSSLSPGCDAASNPYTPTGPGQAEVASP